MNLDIYSVFELRNQDCSNSVIERINLRNAVVITMKKLYK